MNCPICKNVLTRVDIESQCTDSGCPLYLLILPKSDFDQIAQAIAVAEKRGYNAAKEQAARFFDGGGPLSNIATKIILEMQPEPSGM